MTREEIAEVYDRAEYNASLLEDGHWNIGKAQELKRDIKTLLDALTAALDRIEEMEGR